MKWWVKCLNETLVVNRQVGTPKAPPSLSRETSVIHHQTSHPNKFTKPNTGKISYILDNKTLMLTKIV